MSDEIIKPRIDLRQQETLKCEKCESLFFEEVTMIKKVSKLLTGSGEDTIVPFPTTAATCTSESWSPETTATIFKPNCLANWWSRSSWPGTAMMAPWP